MKPTGRKRWVGYLRGQYQVSQRRACRLVPISRKAVRYQALRRPADAMLRKRLQSLGERYPCYGYLMLHEMLKIKGLVQNRKRTYRLYCELGMQVRIKKRKKLVRPRIPLTVPSKPNERWSLDFISDQLFDGRRFRVLNIVDDYDLSPIKVAKTVEGFPYNLLRGGLKMKGKRFSEEKIIGILKEQEAGAKVSDLVRRHSVSEQSIYRWKSKYGGMGVREVKRLRELEQENARLKKLLAEAELDKAMLKDIVAKKW